jgi:hypothetical protein
MVGDEGKKEDQNDSNEKTKELFHIYNLYWMGLQSVNQNQSHVN